MNAVHNIREATGWFLYVDSDLLVFPHRIRRVHPVAAFGAASFDIDSVIAHLARAGLKHKLQLRASQTVGASQSAGASKNFRIVFFFGGGGF